MKMIVLFLFYLSPLLPFSLDIFFAFPSVFINRPFVAETLSLNFQHPVQRPLCRYAYLFRDLNYVLHLFHGAEHALDLCPFHVRADHLAREDIELLVRTVLPESVEQAFFGADDEFPALRFLAEAEHA